nr:hypothetical protein [Tanacetum cinerariifolium]
DSRDRGGENESRMSRGRERAESTTKVDGRDRGGENESRTSRGRERAESITKAEFTAGPSRVHSQPSPQLSRSSRSSQDTAEACLNDLSYIPPNNKQNEPTQGDISETSNELTQAIRNEFKELYTSANDELYLGCDYVTRLDFMAKFNYFKFIRVDHQELKKVIWCVLHNSPKIDMCRVKFKSQVPNKDMNEEFLGWFGLQFIRVDHQELKKVIWCVLHNSPKIDMCRVKFKSQVPNKDMNEEFLGWFGLQATTQLEGQHVNHKKFLNGGVIIVEDDPDIIHVNKSSDLALFTSLNDWEITALHIDGQSIDVDSPPYIIDVDEDDDIIDDEDVLPYDLADSGDEDLVNVVVDDGVVVYSSKEED